MAPDRTNAGARPADVAPQQSEVADLSDILGAALVLGDTHPVDQDRLLGLEVGLGCDPQIRAIEPGLALDSLPRCFAQIRRESLKSDGVSVNEIGVEHARL